MKRLPGIFLILVLLCCCHGRQENGGTATAPDAGDWSPGDELIVEGITLRYADTVEPPHNPEGGLPPNNSTALGEYFNDSNYVQYAAAEQMGIVPIATLREAYFNRRPLVEIASGEHYTVDKLTHSMPYLVPEAARLLDDIGAAFTKSARNKSGKDGYKVVVTSVLRTPASVRSLMRVNKNAVDSSTHKFATTFDLSWSRFDVPDTTNSLSSEQLKMILAEVLSRMRADGRCYVKYEKKSPCFHITVTK